MRVLVTGAGGFIGGHLVKRLLEEGLVVRAVDQKPFDDWWQHFAEAENVMLDLRRWINCKAVCHGVDDVYHLAADMGGIGHIEAHRADCAIHNVLIDTHMLQASRDLGVLRFFYASSACVYPAARQNRPDLPALRERDVFPAQPEEGYGEEKLFMERLSKYMRKDYGLQTRVARFHNIYGPHGSWNDGREKAPAALCRKVAEVKLAGATEIPIWGDGSRTRSFTWIGDCLEGIWLIMQSIESRPLNLGSSEQISVVGLADVIQDIAGVRVPYRFETDKPKGVHGRNSHNGLIRECLDWEPQTRLVDGMTKTYRWIEEQVRAAR